MASPALIAVDSVDAALTDDRFDAVVWVTTDRTAGPSALTGPIAQVASIDRKFGGKTALVFAPEVPGKRVILAPVGRLDRVHDDVRRFADAAKAGLAWARDAGATSPVVCLTADGSPFERTVEATALGAIDATWAPLLAREALGEDSLEPISRIGIVATQAQLDQVMAFEAGRRVARDLCGTEPERMRPEGFAAYCVEAFAGTDVEVEVSSDVSAYPLLASVARASMVVERHRPRIVRLTWRPKGPVHTTLMIAGKGVTYDTGGADLKPSGSMAGMSRDKGGAAAAAGIVRAIAGLAPEGVAVIAELGVVRNSVGPDSFVTDEVITSHAGVRVRIGNTDAEGRLVMADVLSHLREDAAHETNPHLFTLATLTGHSVIAAGPYSIVMDNGPALAKGVAQRIFDAGERWGDPCEISRLRREDVDFVAPRTANEDVVSCNNAPSSRTPRGHQFPMAFLAIAAGLHDGDLPYTHLDIGGSATEGSDWQHGRPSGRPVTAFSAWAAGL